MQKGSTWTVIRRLLWFVVVAAVIHAVARAFWHLQLFRLNKAWLGCDDPSSQIAIPGFGCADAEPTSFWVYTDDLGEIFWSHLIAAIVVLLLLVIVQSAQLIRQHR